MGARLTARIGLLGGTFDPVHNGHLAVAIHLCAELELENVRLILNAVPPHRTPPDCPVEHRLAMLEIAAAGHDRLVPDTRELARSGPSYSVWTLRSLRREFPDSCLCWIVGADAWLGLKSWYRWHELSSLANFIVVKRPGWDLAEARDSRFWSDPEDLSERTAGACVFLDGPLVDVSANDIRERIAAGRDVSELLPQPVWSYIRREGLYSYPQPTP